MTESADLVVALIQVGITAVLAVVTVVYVSLTHRIAKEATRSRQATVFLQVDRMLNALREPRRRLYQFPADFRTWTEEQERIAIDVSGDLNRIANLWQHGLLEKQFLEQAWGIGIIQTWEVLERWVPHYRETTGIPEQRADIERLVDELKRWRERQSPKV